MSRRALAAELEQTFGRDRTRVVYRFADGWTIRRFSTVSDLLREGHMQENCLRDAENEFWSHAWLYVQKSRYSLRNRDNLPQTTFVAWSGGPGPDLTSYGSTRQRVWKEIFNPDRQRGFSFIRARSAFFIGQGPRNLKVKPAHKRRLREFASAASRRLEPFPDDTALRLFACDCAERALRRERKAGRPLDERSVQAVRVARHFARGKATREELWSAYRSSAQARKYAQMACAFATMDGYAHLRRFNAACAAWATTHDIAWFAAWDSGWCTFQALKPDDDAEADRRWLARNVPLA